MSFDFRSDLRNNNIDAADQEPATSATAERCNLFDIDPVGSAEPQPPVDDCALEYVIEPRLPLWDPYRIELLKALERSKVSAVVSFSDWETHTDVEVQINKSATQPTLLPITLKEILIAAHQAGDEGLASNRNTQKLLAGLVSVEKSLQTTHRAIIADDEFFGEPMCREARLDLKAKTIVHGTVLHVDPLRGEMEVTLEGHLFNIRFLSSEIDTRCSSITLSSLSMKSSFQQRSRIYETLSLVKVQSVISVAAIPAGNQYLVPISGLDHLEVGGRDLLFGKQVRRAGRVGFCRAKWNSFFSAFAGSGLSICMFSRCAISARASEPVAEPLMTSSAMAASRSTC